MPATVVGDAVFKLHLIPSGVLYAVIARLDCLVPVTGPATPTARTTP
ncbi:MAG TPA: hypothetical protein VN800_04035 [Candidatus Acidoferrales bacterium]|nr:hypothetical protein [Candidatus Acidoferrales bacterium]